MADKNIEPVAVIHTGFGEKFGIPRQSGLVPEAVGRIVLESKYRNPDALRGIEEFSHLWIIWGFSRNKVEKFTPLVSPPRLGGKVRKGVFATRAPFRPNGIGLSSVKLEKVFIDEAFGPILIVSGVDLLNGTPIYDIKPYLAYPDSHPEAVGSFAEVHCKDRIEVIFPENLKQRLPCTLQDTVKEVLAQDPRAAYNKQPDYVYGMAFGGYDIRFTVDKGQLFVCDVIERMDGKCDKIK